MSPTDYEAVNKVVTFAPCESRCCVSLNITDDDIGSEQNETFSLSLTRATYTPFFIALGSTTAEVVITNCKQNDIFGKSLAYMIKPFA